MKFGAEGDCGGEAEATAFATAAAATAGSKSAEDSTALMSKASGRAPTLPAPPAPATLTEGSSRDRGP